MVSGSRPISAQRSRIVASFVRSSSSEPPAFHWSPYRASVRSVFLGPEPPIMIGRCGWIGRGATSASCIG